MSSLLVAMHRQNWVRAFKRTFIWIAGSAAALLLVLYVPKIIREYISFKTDLSSYQGIKLDAPMQEAFYAFGEPNEVLGKPVYDNALKGSWLPVYQVDGKDLKNKMPLDSVIRDYTEWMYDLADHRLDLTFDAKTKRISEIGCYVSQNASPRLCPTIFGINSHDNEETVIRKIGQPTSSEYANYIKVLHYAPLGFDVLLERREVYSLKKKAATAGFAWYVLHKKF